ncbi:MAG: DUF2652 domain-containing protein [Longimicrobiales bacterium]
MTQPTIQNGYLVLVDLSGYTPFMASSELDHAQGILANLLELLRSRLTPTLTLAEIEGDALFLYAPAHALTRGETLLELIESTYVVFRDSMRTVQRATTCNCNACQVMRTLDLKFVTHSGEYVLQRLAGGVKPVGSSVNLAHRLLKNRVTETTGWSAYALFTQAALEAMDVRPEGMHPDRIRYEHLGEYDVAAIDLQRRYEELTAKRGAYLAAEQAHFTVERRFAVPLPRLWDLLNDPLKRVQWEIRSDWETPTRPAGRTGPGAHNHCADSDFIEEVLDWRPFDYYTVQIRRSIMRFTITGALRADGDCTALRWSIAMDGTAPVRWRALITRFFATRLMRASQRFDRLERLIAREEEKHAAAVPIAVDADAS